MKKLVSFVALLGSTTTLVCCVLPAIFVMLGFGATFASFVGAFPQITWLSEHKGLVFGISALLIGVAAFMQWRARALSCPPDPKLAAACRETRGVSRGVLLLSVGLYCIGAFVAFIAPLIFT